MEHLIVGKAVKYGASKSDAATRTATSAADLADGSVGLFGLCNDGKTRLIVTAAGSNAATTVTVATFTAGIDATYGGKKFYWAVGTTDSCLTTNPVEYKASMDSVATRSKENVLPLRQLSYVGYNPVDAIGTLNLSTAVLNDSISLGVNYTYPVESIYNVKNYNTGLIVGDSVYEQIRKLVAAINSDSPAILQADIVGAAGTQVAVADSAANRTFTKGSPIVTLGGVATTIIAGDWIRVQNLQPLSGASTGINTLTAAATAANSVLYKVASKTGTTSITLDRPYTGETQTVNITTFNASVIRETALSTNLGIRLIGVTNPYIAAYPKYVNFSFNLTGLDNLQNATIYDRPANGVTGFRGVTSGSGTTNQLLDLEKRAITFSGGQSLWGDATLQWAKGFVSRVDTSCNTYDMYFTTYIPDIQLSSTVGGDTKGEPILLSVGFPSADYSAGDNQYDYDVLIKVLGQYSGDVNIDVA